MECPWKVSSPVETVSFAEVLSEDYAHNLQEKENKRLEARIKKLVNNNVQDDSASSSSKTSESTSKKQLIQDNGEIWEDYSALLSEAELKDTSVETCHDDETIARLLQYQFNHEFNEELRRIEQQRNKQSKLRISLDNFRRESDFKFLKDDEENEDEELGYKRDWDRFETNEKKLENIPKCGFKVDEEGEMVTKHDPHLCGVRNACRVMSFPLHLSTGDAAGFEMSLSNRVFNQLKAYSHRRVNSVPNSKKTKRNNRKENLATAEMGVDVRTRLLLYKLINKQLLEQINGIVSTGKEALILHANSDPNYVETDHVPNKKGSSKNENVETGENLEAKQQPKELPKECAIKIFRTTLNEFKQRDRYIKDDFRFKGRYSSQNNFYIINLWAEKEMHNLKRMKAVGINCPDVVTLKKHVLVMSFIGDNHNAAPKLKNAQLSDAELSCAYEEIIDTMYKMYNNAKLVHADLSEYNILWYDGKCWFIDVAQSVEPEHPSALEFLLRDCGNIINFFKKRGLPNIFTKEELFKHITSLNAETQVGLLERMHTRGASLQMATAPDQEDCPDELKPLSYPFNLAWDKSQEPKKKSKIPETEICNTADNAMSVLSISCSAEADDNHQKNNIENTSFAAIVALGTCPDTAKN